MNELTAVCPQCCCTTERQSQVQDAGYGYRSVVFACPFSRATDQPLTIDHVVPVALGGRDDPSNLVSACRDCNAGKSSTSPESTTVADVERDALRWAAAMQEAASMLEARGNAQAQYSAAFLSVWPRHLPSNWEPSIINFYRAGLPEAELVKAVRVALSTRGVDNRFNYFCGICWKKIKQIQEIANQIVQEERSDADSNDGGLSELDAEWLRGYDAAEARLGADHFYGRQLRLVVDGPTVSDSIWGVPA